MFDPKLITTAWFFSEPPKLIKYIGIYVKGDALVIVPFLILILFILSISLRFGIVLVSTFFAVRGLGEMIYWLLQQFGPKTYRPWDYGMKNLSNEGVYVFYQLTSMLHIVIGIAVAIYAIFFWSYYATFQP